LRVSDVEGVEQQVQRVVHSRNQEFNKINNLIKPPIERSGLLFVLVNSDQRSAAAAPLVYDALLQHGAEGLGH
jgi:hypothetical protein